LITPAAWSVPGGQWLAGKPAARRLFCADELTRGIRPQPAWEMLRNLDASAHASHHAAADV